ncbi:MAG TPA: hypothetical protein VD838_17950, partial [Anaeromyxobacteraceae bacterium]|nr:hypothetical protein [Anaeromyxobacteraceae bacterium]
ASTTRFYADAVARGAVIGSAPVEVEPPADGFGSWAAVLRHEKVPFVTYPWEWPFGMLKDAALLQLDLLLAALDEGFVLKDATPYNVQWRGARPVFIDVASFERLTPGDPWPAYRQFCQLFLYPLMLQAYRGIAFQPWLRGAIDGIPPEDARRLFGWRDFLRPGVWVDVALLARATRAGGSLSSEEARARLRAAGFDRRMLAASVARLRRIVARLEPSRTRSEWSEYVSENGYDADARAEKAELVRAAVRRRGGTVWDLGCNTGEYTRLAAETASLVVAVDADHVCVDRLYAAIKDAPAGRSVLPLVANLADLPGGVGWRGRERTSLPERGAPDVVLALALLHHLVLGANLPLDEVVEWFASFGGDLVVEFVHEADPMAQRLLARRTAPRPDYRAEHLERCLGAAWRHVTRHPLPGGTRTVYVAEAGS